MADDVVFSQEHLHLITEKITNKWGYALDKYNGRAGCYCIYIDNKLVYIGKSTNLLKRIIAHIYHIENETKEHKYEILNEARKNRNKISFDVIYYTDKTNKEEIEKDIEIKEGFFIRKYHPPLNCLIPNENNERYTVNKEAKTIILEEILLQDDTKIDSEIT